ncbi:MAG: 16S rRNA (guanine(527)-N(7))-methyltransferase RsmG [Anaerolineaceae bacterium]|nr:MAG: 16S rRNA (guanine(527)-N(7))-methyltransferase RsmG [Anaerolineaceae bacterium]
MVGYEGFAKTTSSLLGLQLTHRQLEAFDWYASELVEWDRRFNLTAVTDSQGIEVKHFLDSLTCLQAMGPRPAGRVVDVGTGGGFPGLPLKIVFPRLELTLVESIGKKVEFCRHVVRSLRLEGVEIVHDRVERVGHQPEHRGVYDWALARAVATMPVLVEYLLPLLKLGGRVVVQKGETGPAEVHTAEGALRILGGRVDQLIPIELPTVVECRYLVVVDKIAATPEKYPRRPGIPAKRPLK